MYLQADARKDYTRNRLVPRPHIKTNIPYWEENSSATCLGVQVVFIFDKRTRTGRHGSTHESHNSSTFRERRWLSRYVCYRAVFCTKFCRGAQLRAITTSIQGSSIGSFRRQSVYRLLCPPIPVPNIPSNLNPGESYSTICPSRSLQDAARPLWRRAKTR